MTAPDSGLRFTWRLIPPLATGFCNSPKRSPPPQNRFQNKGLQGLTFDEFILHNEKLDYCVTEQTIDHCRAGDTDAGQERIARPRS